MKIKRHKIISFICVIIIFFITNLTQTNAIGNNAYTVINSQTLLESNTLDTLTLNYNKLPSISVSGSEEYVVSDVQSAANSELTVREVKFPNAKRGETLDSVVTVTFNNCGKLNGKSINMKLIYSDIVTKGNSPLLYWTAYGSSMASNNEWWYKLIEHVTVKIYFYYSGSTTPINLNTGYLSIFSEDPEEGASSKTSSDRYLYEKTRMNYSASIPSQYVVSRTYKNVLYGTGKTMDSTEAGTLECVSFQYKNTNNIEVELYALNTKTDVGYHFQYDSLTASIPTNPEKTVDKTVANTGDTVTYTVTQNISKALDKNFYYTSLVFKDVLNSNLAYVSLTVNDPNNKNITNTAGTTIYDPSTRTLKYTFSSNYLKNMNYKGQIYKFIIKAKINSSTTSGSITNTSSTIINNSSAYTLKSNTTTTKIPYKVIVNHVDEKGKKIVDSETIQGYEKDKYTTKAKAIYGYELTKTPANSTGTMTENVITVTYRYKLKDTKIVAKYVNEQGKEIAESETVNGKVFDKYSTEPKNIYGYKLIKVPENKDGTMEENIINVIYKYQLKDTKVVTKYVNEEGKEIAESETVKGRVFDEYSTKPKSIYGYELVEIPLNCKGTMKEYNITVVYYYTIKNTKVITKYVNEEEKEIADSEIVNGKVFDKYSTESKNIYGYKLTEEPENKNGIMEENTINVTYKYQLKDTKVVTKYIAEEGKEIAESETVNGKVFDKYSTEPKNIYGYKLIEEPKNKKGIMEEDTINVTYKYQLKDTKVVTKYVDEQGKEIADSESLEGKVFDKYSTKSKNIYGYKLIEEPSNKEGIMVEDTTDVIYRYKLKDSEVISKYLDTEGKEIAENKITKGKVFSNYTTEPKEIEGYKLKEIPKNKDGIIQENNNIVTYNYRKLEFNISVSQKLAKVILNNNEIKGISKKLEIDRITNVNSLKLIYTILVSNHSELDGTTVIYYDIPDGYVALEQENVEWTINGKVAYRKVDDLVVNSSKDFTITLTATSSEVVGTLANKVSCKHSSCKVGYQETTLTDNVDITELIISISTGLKKDTIKIVLVILIVLIVSVIILCIAKKMTSKCKH